jgi:hypothetical protein
MNRTIAMAACCVVSFLAGFGVAADVNRTGAPIEVIVVELNRAASRTGDGE